MESLLIEIGVEELPAKPLIKELANCVKKYRLACESFGIDSDFRFDFTPRRLVFFHTDFPAKQPSRVKRVFGPPAEEGGLASAAAIGFAKKCGARIDELGVTEQKGRKVFFYEQTFEGKEIGEIIPLLLKSYLNSLSFGKAMRWGANSFEFIRPVRSLMVLHNDRLIDCELFGVKSAKSTFVHRSYSFDLQPIENGADFERFLQERGVLLDSKKRRENILESFDRIEKEHNLSIDRDPDLLDEVTAITEYPTALLGSFDRGFLELPSEVIITSMKTNQRYFPVFENGRLTNHFVVISNAFTDDFDAIIKGNEKVLRPRLNDALFFWRNDLKNGLQDEPLKGISYAYGLGTIYDKQAREQIVAKRLTKFMNISDQYIDRAVEISKRDLASQMVYEFTELQGVMGRRYAEKLGEDEAVAVALYEQYLPLGEDSALPATQTGALLAIVTKIDALMSLFSIGSAPSGSKDPFALRRAAASIAKIAISFNWRFNIRRCLTLLADLYKPFDIEPLIAFFKERLVAVLGANGSIVKAVLAAGEEDVLAVNNKVKALLCVSKTDRFEENLALFKRVANILKDQSAESGSVDESLFEKKEEGRLFEAFSAIDAKDDLELLNALFGLKKPLDEFFDAVMINAEDQKLRENRLALMRLIYAAFLKVADIKEIAF
ncbi:MAG: glycine--tRNA ligase subunit beta [Helicobacteraceae bacterium]|nr:glycine--tRNA ligase subunit beta [Helicobacteraceae bacterium]